MLCPFNVSLKGEKLFITDYLALGSFHPHYTEKIKLTLKLWIRGKCLQTLTFSACYILFGLFPPLLLSLRLAQLSWREREEIHVPGRVSVSNRSAGAAAVAGISITSTVPFLPRIDQLPVSG